MSLRYIIDGHNVIHHPRFARLLGKETQDCRLFFPALIRTKGLCKSVKNCVIVVYDGYPPSSSRTSRPASQPENTFVVFSGSETADERIRKLLEKCANPRAAVVVSDDKEIRFFAKGLGARVMGVEEFLEPGIAAPRRTASEHAKPELGQSEVRRINEELKRIWLKK